MVRILSESFTGSRNGLGIGFGSSNGFSGSGGIGSIAFSSTLREIVGLPKAPVASLRGRCTKLLGLVGGSGSFSVSPRLTRLRLIQNTNAKQQTMKNTMEPAIAPMSCSKCMGEGGEEVEELLLLFMSTFPGVGVGSVNRLVADGCCVNALGYFSKSRTHQWHINRTYGFRLA